MPDDDESMEDAPDEAGIPPSEAARDRRRDHDAEAKSRAGMRTGLAKQFKQVLDSQRRRAEEPPAKGPRRG
jgi:hypothetical protein